MESLCGFMSTPAEMGLKQIALRTAGGTAISSICGYGGTVLFTVFNPLSAAIYCGSVALISQIAYHILEKCKAQVDSKPIRYMIIAVQLLQIPFCFYLLPSPLGVVLTAVEKLEMVAATAHFTAIPIFFYLAIEASRDPTPGNIALAVGVLLPLASGLRGYAKNFS